MLLHERRRIADAVPVTTNADRAEDDDGEPRKTLASTTVAQLFSFGLFVASAVIAVNNLLDAQYRYSTMMSLKDFIAVVDDDLRLFASVVVMFFSISSPFEEDEPFVISLSGTHNSFFRVMFFASLCFTSMSEVVEDPKVLFNEFRTVLLSVVDEADNLIEPIVDIVDDDSLQEVMDMSIDVTFATAFGENFVRAMIFSKAFCFVSSILYALSIVLTDLPDFKKETIRRFVESLWGRVGQIIVLGANAYAMYLTNALGFLEDRESHRRLRQLATIDLDRIRDGIDVGSNFTDIFDTEETGGLVQAVMALDSIALYNVSMLLMLFVAGYVTLFYNKYKFALPLLMYMSSKNLVLIEETTTEETFYTILFALTIVLITSTGAFLISLGKLTNSLRFLPNVLYKLGLILCVVCLPVLLLGWTHPWLELTITPVQITAPVITAVDRVVNELDDVYHSLADHLSVLNPCVRPVTVDIDRAIGNATDLEAALAQVDEEVRRNRVTMAKEGGIFFSNLEDCIEKDWPHDWRIHKIRRIRIFKRAGCKRMQRKERQMRELITDKIKEEVAQNRLQSSDLKEFGLDNPYYVDDFCTTIKCSIITYITAALLILAKIPFVGTVASAMKDVVNTSYKIWKFARRLFKKTPRLLKKKKSLLKLKKRLQKFILAQTKRTVTPNQTLTWIFFPVLLSAGIALTLIMIRRQTAVGKNKIAAKFMVAMKIAIGLALPVCAAEIAVLVVMVYYPVFVNKMLGFLPEALMKAELEVDIGLEAMKAAYLISILGNLSIIAGAATYLEVEIVIFIINQVKRLFRFTVYLGVRVVRFSKRLLRGRLTANENAYHHLRTWGDGSDGGDSSSEDDDDDDEDAGAKDGGDHKRTHVKHAVRAKHGGKQNPHHHHGTAKTKALVETSARRGGGGTIAKRLKLTVLMFLGLAKNTTEEGQEAVYTLLDWRVQYLQPLIFSIFPIPYIIATTHELKYVQFNFVVKPEVAQAAQEITDTETTAREVDDIIDEFSDIGCGAIDRIAKVTLLALQYTLEAVLKPFSAVFEILTKQIARLNSILENFIYVDPFAVPDVISETLTNTIVFGVPVFCTAVLLFIWVASLFGSAVYVIKPLRKTLGTDEVKIDDLMGVCAGAILAISLTMISVHLIIGAVFQTIQDTDIPFFHFEVILGWKYYMVIIAHMCNAMSAIAHYVNTLVPPINFN